MFKPNKIIFAAFLLLCYSSAAHSQPVINTAKGTFSEGQSFNINGTGFGTNGPNNILFDDFNGGVTGGEIPLTSPSTGSWSGYGSYHPIYSNVAHSGKTSMQTADGQAYQLQFKHVFPAATEVFVSYWMKVPTGTNFPGATTPNTLATISSWKLAWFMDGDQGYHLDDDIWLPAWTGKNWNTTGNLPGAGWYPTNISNGNWFTFDGWMRLSFWLKAGANPTTDVGSAYMQILTEGVKQSIYSGPTGGATTPIPLFAAGVGNGIPQYTQLNVPGWVYVNQGVQPVYDDVYVATGPGALARVEIGDNPIYSQCKKLDILVPSSWSDTSITVSPRSPNYSAGNTVYLFVFDSNGLSNDTGYPIQISQSYSSLPAPTNVKVVKVN